jgi:hypothetical protein
MNDKCYCKINIDNYETECSQGSCDNLKYNNRGGGVRFTSVRGACDVEMYDRTGNILGTMRSDATKTYSSSLQAPEAGKIRIVNRRCPLMFDRQE